MGPAPTVAKSTQVSRSTPFERARSNRAQTLTPRQADGYSWPSRVLAACAGVMKWQTCQTQNLVGGNLRVGSSPTAGRGLILMRGIGARRSLIRSSRVMWHRFQWTLLAEQQDARGSVVHDEPRDMTYRRRPLPGMRLRRLPSAEDYHVRLYLRCNRDDHVFRPASFKTFCK